MTRHVLFSIRTRKAAATVLSIVALSSTWACTHAGSIGGKHPSTRDPSVPTRAPGEHHRTRRTSSAAAYRELLRLHAENQEAMQVEPRAGQNDVEVCRTACRRSVQICDLQQQICDDADDDPSDENVDNCREARGYCENAKRDCTTCSGHAGRTNAACIEGNRAFDLASERSASCNENQIITVSTAPRAGRNAVRR